MRKYTFAVALLLPVACCAQSKFLDMWVGQVRSDQTAQFDALVRKMADANRKAKDKGDSWIAYQDYYGALGRTYLVSSRAGLDEITEAEAKFLGALKEFGGITPEKFSSDISRATMNAHGELHTRRWDLSFNVPKDPAESIHLLASARFLRVVTLSVKAGHTVAVEKQLGVLKRAMENAETKVPGFVSQSFAGAPGTVYSIVGVASTMGELEKRPTAQAVMGESAYSEFSGSLGENVENIEFRIVRIIPEWSNPPKEIADADPAFWRPKPAAAPKPKAAESPKAGT
jgi:hypothetical protein